MTLSRGEFLSLSGSGALSAALGLSACAVDPSADTQSNAVPPVIDASVPLASPGPGTRSRENPPCHGRRVGHLVHLRACRDGGALRRIASEPIGIAPPATPTPARTRTIVRHESELSGRRGSRTGLIPSFQGLQMVEAGPRSDSRVQGTRRRRHGHHAQLEELERRRLPRAHGSPPYRARAPGCAGDEHRGSPR